jgi:ABC-type long-subunit fatty acid transport system fused permease/ATPase subunit
MEKHIKKVEETLVRDVDGVVRSVEETTEHFRKTVLQRFPFLIIGLSTFGLVAVLYSFEQVISMIPILERNPLLVFLLGITALGVTGTLYKKLQ